MNWPNQVVYLPSNSQMFKAQIPSNPHKSSTSPKFLNLLSPKMDVSELEAVPWYP
jgi:hypothetical protein